MWPVYHLVLYVFRDAKATGIAELDCNANSHFQSGAIMAVLGYVCIRYGDSQLSILFLPMLTLKAATAIKFILGVDIAGCVLGWKLFDHAAHLGGALFGM